MKPDSSRKVVFSLLIVLLVGSLKLFNLPLPIWFFASIYWFPCFFRGTNYLSSAGWLLLFFLCCLYLSSIFNNSFDLLGQVWFARELIASLLAPYLLVKLVKSFRLNKQSVLDCICFAISINIFFALLFFFYPPVYDLYSTIFFKSQIQQSLEAVNDSLLQTRLFGLGLSYFSGGATLSLVTIIYAEARKNKTQYEALIVFLGFVVSFLIARSSFIVLVIYLIARLCFASVKIAKSFYFLRFQVHYLIKYFFYACIAALLFILMPLMFDNLSSLPGEYSKIVDWSIGSIQNIISKGPLADTSFSETVGHYELFRFENENVLTFFLGHARLFDNNGLSYFMGVDPGFLRVYLFLGIAGITLFLCANIYPLLNEFRNIYTLFFCPLTLTLVLVFFALNLKGLYFIGIPTSLFLAHRSALD